MLKSYVDSQFWRGKKVFVTGHTGFKGSWLSLWLTHMGAKVKGFSLKPPTTPSLFEVANVANGIDSEIGDIRDRDSIYKSIVEFNPEILIHMAAQPLVRLSYDEPVETYATNVMGTVHVLEAARQCNALKAIVNVTTDKCYENQEWEWGYRENEPMGGHDPYSNSKGCVELVTSAYRNSFFHVLGSPKLATARAGNVIGGGDWALDRLIPDALKAFEKNQTVIIRNPLATRPWQHVLEPLSGYLVLAQRLFHEFETGSELSKNASFADGWNFGPKDEDALPVKEILDKMVSAWGEGASWELDKESHPHEASFLKLDISKAKQRLQWRPTWALEKTLYKIVLWHKAWNAGSSMNAKCIDEIKEYMNDMKA